MPSFSTALCYFNFSGCGYFACEGNTTGFGINTYFCAQSMDQCCQCIQYLRYCTNVNGIDCDWYVYNNSTCSGGHCSGTMPTRVEHPQD